MGKVFSCAAAGNWKLSIFKKPLLFCQKLLVTDERVQLWKPGLSYPPQPLHLPAIQNVVTACTYREQPALGDEAGSCTDVQYFIWPSPSKGLQL